MDSSSDVFKALGIALGLGLLVGLQRQRADSRMAGIRTFPLITLLGTVCALLSSAFGGWVVAAGFLTVGVLIAVSNQAKLRSEDKEPEPGQTTEAAALLMYGVGAYVAVGNQAAAIVVGGIVAVLLHYREPLHRLVEKMGEIDARALMQFVLIALVILPILPNRDYGPYGVFNPYDIWRMVVLIVGIGIAGYVAYKMFGQGAGTLLGGILGGLISSTATTVSYARRSKDTPDASTLAALVILIASTVAFARIIAEVAAVAPGILGRVAPPLGAMLLLMIVLSAVAYFRNREDAGEMPEQENPAELKSALWFGALYALILYGVAAVKDHFGNSGLYVVAVLSGLTDVDAITLSTANMMEAERMETDTGWRLILTAALSNLVFKAGTVAVLGHRRLLGRIALLFGIALIGGILILFLWPDRFNLG